MDYFTLGSKKKLLDEFDLSNDILEKYTLDDRFKYGFPISTSEYGVSMKTLILALNQNFKNKINVKKVLKSVI